MADLAADLASPEFLHGVGQDFWEMPERVGELVYVSLHAPDGRSYMAQFDCSSYWVQPIRCLFVNPATKAVDDFLAERKSDLRRLGQVQHVATRQTLYLLGSGPGRHRYRRAHRVASTNKMAKRTKPNRRLLEFLTKAVARRVQRILPPEVEHDTLHIDRHILDHTVAGLRERSDGWRESGAIWIGTLDGSKSIVQDVRFFHDLCDDKGRSLSLELSEEAKFALYEDLSKTGQKLVGMIHTHPRDWVDLSEVDRGNQLCSRIGFWSLVLPHYAANPWRVGKTGVHIRADQGWYWLTKKESLKRIVVL